MIKSIVKFLAFGLRRPWNITLFSLVFILLVLRFVELKPQVDKDFFFSSDSAQFQAEKEIAAMFPYASQIIVSAKGDIRQAKYLENIERLTAEFGRLTGITGVKSLAQGPNDLEDALKSPLWRRLLIPVDQQSSNLVLFLSDVPAEIIIPQIEKIAAKFNQDDFQLRIAGSAYVVEMIRRNLMHDLFIFSGAAILIFALVIFLIFWSLKILLGTVTTCVNACVITLALAQAFGIKIGILTANLATIVFVLTLSHIIFITNNFLKSTELAGGEIKSAVWASLKLTFNGSFWCMITTLLGFLSLIFVPAKPLRELGYSGSIGTLVSIVLAYTIYPLFLSSLTQKKKTKSVDAQAQRLFIGHYMWAVVVFAGFAGFCAAGLKNVNTDPELLSYFKTGSELRKGLEYIDSSGGSSPLNLVIQDSQNQTLNKGIVYKRLWQLQENLEKDDSVGSVISLPVLLAESKRAPLAFLLSLEGLLRIMENPQYDRITNSFVTKDRKYGHFFLRMKETGRQATRAQAVERIKTIVRANGFDPYLVGGIYILQGEMAKLVSQSLLGGLGKLILLFLVIAFIVARCFKTALAMTGCLAMLPLCVLGLAGYFKIPLDIISAPAVNVAIGIGIDSMIHMVIVVRRYLAKGVGVWQAWRTARHQLWQPVTSSMVIVSAGFGIFGFSAFPPTQRFGLAVILGIVLAGPIALFVLPAVVGPWFYRD